jgi:hypothetical protein
MTNLEAISPISVRDVPYIVSTFQIEDPRDIEKIITETEKRVRGYVEPTFQIVEDYIKFLIEDITNKKPNPKVSTRSDSKLSDLILDCTNKAYSKHNRPNKLSYTQTKGLITLFFASDGDVPAIVRETEYSRSTVDGYTKYARRMLRWARKKFKTPEQASYHLGPPATIFEKYWSCHIKKRNRLTAKEEQSIISDSDLYRRNISEHSRRSGIGYVTLRRKYKINGIEPKYKPRPPNEQEKSTVLKAFCESDYSATKASKLLKLWNKPFNSPTTIIKICRDEGYTIKPKGWQKKYNPANQ